MQIELTKEEAEFIMNLLNQIQIPLSSSNGLQSYMAGSSVRKKLLEATKADREGSDRDSLQHSSYRSG